MTESQIELLLETLRWYADSTNYRRVVHAAPPGRQCSGGLPWSNPPISIDKGARANFVLTQIESK